jgi:hypothetical protein
MKLYIRVRERRVIKIQIKEFDYGHDISCKAIPLRVLVI